jgi:galactokinase
MTNASQRIRISTPGRICLFGEHQDYLRLPVIPAAISLRIAIEGEAQNSDRIDISLPDIGKKISFSLSQPLVYSGDRDYFRSGVNVLRRAGYEFPHGFSCTVHGEIPINAGTSSSSALTVSWINFLAHMSNRRQQLPPGEIALYAVRAEVEEFGEPGGRMDQYSTAIGGVLSLTFHPAQLLERLSPPMKTFVLGNSRQPKDTKRILARVKGGVLAIVEKLRHHPEPFSLFETRPEDLDRWTKALSDDERQLLHGTIRNRDITMEALALLRLNPLDEQRLFALMNEHQEILRDVLGISTPKIDRMLDAAMQAGARGGKINGSGGGGCMFVYAPAGAEAVADAIRREGGDAFIVSIDEGTRREV